MSFWEDVFNNLLDAGPSNSGASTTIQPQPRNEWKNEQLDAALQDILFDKVAIVKAQYLRAMVETDQWFVATNADGSMLRLDVKPGTYSLAMQQNDYPGKKKKKSGKGGRLLPIYATLPDCLTIPGKLRSGRCKSAVERDIYIMIHRYGARIQNFHKRISSFRRIPIGNPLPGAHRQRLECRFALSVLRSST